MGAIAVTTTHVQPGPEETAERLIDAAWAMYESDQHRDAIEQANRALAIEPQSVRARCVISFALSGLGCHPEAFAAAKDAIVLAPTEGLAHYALSNAIDRDPRPRMQADWPSAGFVYPEWARQQWMAAEEAGLEAVRHSPAEPSFHLHLAEMWMRRGAFDHAEQAVSNALRIDPSSGAALSLRAEIILARNRWGKAGSRAAAAEVAADSVTLEPGSARAHCVRADALLATGDPEGARDHYLSALELDPSVGTTDGFRAGYAAATLRSAPLYGLTVGWFGENDLLRVMLAGGGAFAALLSPIALSTDGFGRPPPIPYDTPMWYTGAAAAVLAALLAVHAVLSPSLYYWAVLRDPIGRTCACVNQRHLCYWATAAAASLPFVGTAFALLALRG